MRSNNDKNWNVFIWKKKMKKKLIYITKELSSTNINIKKLISCEKYLTLKKNSYKQINQEKANKKEIYIYDYSFIKTKNQKPKIYSINNHINKTGENPLRGTQKKEINFYDITQIYKQTKKGKIAECFGDKKQTKKRRNHITAHFLCNHSINAHLAGFKKINAFVIG